MNCRGHVILEQCGGEKLVVLNSANVQLSRANTYFFYFDSSNVILSGSRFGPAGPAQNSRLPGGEVYSSRVTVADSEIGGDGGTFQQSGCFTIVPPTHAMFAKDSEIVVTGPKSRIQGGRHGDGVYCPITNEQPGIWSGGNVHVIQDPASQINRIYGGVTLTTRHTPVLTGKGAGAGSSAEITLRTEKLTNFWLLASLPAYANAAGFGFDLYLDWGTCVPIFAGQTDVLGAYTLQLPVPPTVPRGAGISWQALVGIKFPPAMRASTPVSLVMTTYNFGL